MLFRKKESKFEQNITLTELEQMLPFERKIYILLFNQEVDKAEQESNNQ